MLYVSISIYYIRYISPVYVEYNLFQLRMKLEGSSSYCQLSVGDNKIKNEE